jgi:hypothetical protein
MQFVHVMGSYVWDPEKFNYLLYREEPTQSAV